MELLSTMKAIGVIMLMMSLHEIAVSYAQVSRVHIKQTFKFFK